jgi:cobalt-precorrin 5A hydrolase/precorrin-3B C17-methyltransferase
MTVISVSITEAARRLAGQLPFEHVHGSLATVVRERWTDDDVDGFVLFVATGAAVRIVAPLLADKQSDPAVVCVDEAGRFAIALCGGHDGGANELARRVGLLLDATPVITTATDATGLVALDQLPGFVASGDIAGVTATLLDGRSPIVDNPRAWPLPEGVPASGSGPERILVTDASTDQVQTDGDVPGPPTVLLRPPSLVVGVGSSTGAQSDEVLALETTTLAEAGLSPDSLQTVATIDRRRHHPAITGLGLPVTAFPAETLAQLAVPNPSDAVRRAVGTASVCEAAALLAAGEGADLVVEKRTSKNATVPSDASCWWGWAPAASSTGHRRPSGRFIEPTWSSAIRPMSINARTCWPPIIGSSDRRWAPRWSGRVRLSPWPRRERPWPWCAPAMPASMPWPRRSWS